MVMEKIRFYSSSIWVSRLGKIKLSKRVLLVVDKKLKGFKFPSGCVKIYLQFEPEAVKSRQKFLVKNKRCFDHILTYSRYVLHRCKNAVFYNATFPEIGEGYKAIWPDKLFGVSIVVDKTGRAVPGQLMRHELWKRQFEVKMPRMFYRSGLYKSLGLLIHGEGMENLDNNPVLGDSKHPLFQYQYHFVIEGDLGDYCFSEKLIDCFLGKSIPIFIGSPGIDKFFNPAGIIRVTTVGQAIEACNSLRPGQYESLKDAIEDNYRRALPYLEKRYLRLERFMEGLLCK